MRVGINAQKALERETGIGNYTYHLVRTLAQLPEAAETVRLYALGGRAKLAEITGDLPLSGRDNMAAGSAARIAWEQFALPGIARRDQLDVLHCVDHALPLIGNPCPVIITVHDLAFYRLPHMYNLGRRLYKQYVGLRSVRRAAHVIVNSETTRQEVMALSGLPEQKITVIHYGLDASFCPLSAEAEKEVRRRYDLTKPFFLFVGTLQPRKNLKTLIAAFARLVRRHDLPHELVLAGGKGWLTSDLTAYAGQRRLADRLRFLGSVPQNELPALYNCAESLVYPSWYEGFGLPPLEAMGCGCPVVASNAASIREVVGDAGLLIDPDDVEALAAAMHQVTVDRGLRKKLVQSGLRRAGDFSWRQSARATMDVYRRVYEENGGAK